MGNVKSIESHAKYNSLRVAHQQLEILRPQLLLDFVAEYAHQLDFLGTDMNTPTDRQPDGPTGQRSQIHIPCLFTDLLALTYVFVLVDLNVRTVGVFGDGDGHFGAVREALQDEVLDVVEAVHLEDEGLGDERGHSPV